MQVDASGITVTIGAKTILENASLSVRGGEIVGLIGPNGAGKSTLIRALANLIQPQTGTIRYDNRELASFSARQLARNVAYLAQGTTAHWPMTVEQLVALGRLPHRAPGRGLSDGDLHAIEHAMTMTNVTEFRNRTLGTLSGGERMRVMLARALAVSAPILLADEPIAALDPFHQLQIMDVLRGAARRGTAVIAILHELTLAARFCDRLALLAGGRIQGEGSPDAVLTPENLAAAYRVECVFGRHDDQSFVIPWTRARLDRDAPRDAAHPG
jgi:iron complex transport system ATP-binding protein